MQQTTHNGVENLNVESQNILITPAELKAQLPLTPTAMTTVKAGREAVRNILDGTDPRLLVVIGPCSIHDTKAAMDYAHRLKALNEKVKDSLLIVMRVYFEKPRTTTGWKGLINDPHINDSFKIVENCCWILLNWAYPRPPKRSTRFLRSICKI